MTDRLSELAKALADASDRLNGTNHRDDQRLMEEVATRIQARVDDYDAAYAALEAYGVSKASEGAVKVEIETDDQKFGRQMRELHPSRSGGDPRFQGVLGVAPALYQTAEPQPSYSNGLDGHKED